MTAPSFGTQLSQFKRVRRISAISAVSLALVVGTGIVLSEVRGNYRVLNALAGHVENLIETQDRTELQRLLSSAATGGDLIEVVEDGFLIANSANIRSLDRPYSNGTGLRVSKGISISLKGLKTTLQVGNGERQNGNSEIILTTPILHLLVLSTLVVLCVLVVGLSIGRKWSAAVVDTRAKELAAVAYRRLIHDLHNPVSAIGAIAKLIVRADCSSDEQKDLVKDLAVVCDQARLQMTAAKENLEFETKQAKVSDIRQCLEDAAKQASLSSPRYSEVSVRSEFPDAPIVYAHDERLLRRAVSNLVKNAIEACSQSVLLTLKELPEGAVIIVEDDGIGMSKEAVATYLQGRGRSTKGDRQAHGLSAANHIIREHGGRIIYRASGLGGSRFEIHLGVA